MKPAYILLATSLLMGVAAMNYQWGIPGLGFMAFVISLLIIIYAHDQSSSEGSDFLDKEFETEYDVEKERAQEVYVRGGVSAGILSRLLSLGKKQLHKEDPSGRTEYNLTYTIAFVLWLPVCWFIWTMILL